MAKLNKKKTVNTDPGRFLKSNLDKGRYEGTQNERKRLNDVRDIFYEREIHEKSNRISLAEGGCFHPTPLNVLEKFIDAAINIDSYPAQIYPQQNVIPDFIEKIWRYFSDACKIPLDEHKHAVAFGFGSSHLYDIFLSSVAEPGSIVLMPESYYHAFSEWPAKWQAEARCIKTQKRNAYKLVADDLKKWCQENPSLISKVCCLALTNPTTTGSSYSYEEIDSLAKIIEEYDFLVFSDEVFKDTQFIGSEIKSFASHPYLTDRVVTASSGSKSRSVADLRIGWACGPKAIIDRMIWHMEHSFTEVPLYLQQIGIEILNIDYKFFEREKSEYKNRVKVTRNLVDISNKRLSMKFSQEKEFIEIVHMPTSGHYICLDFGAVKGWLTPEGKPILSSEDLCRYFYYHHHETENGDLQHGVCFSCGHSKGHDDLILYLAYAQPGYEYAVEEALPYYRYNLAHYMLRKLAPDQIADSKIKAALQDLGIQAVPNEPDYRAAQNVGRQILCDAFDRVVCALQHLKPPMRVIENNE